MTTMEEKIKVFFDYSSRRELFVKAKELAKIKDFREFRESVGQDYDEFVITIDAHNDIYFTFDAGSSIDLSLEDIIDYENSIQKYTKERDAYYQNRELYVKIAAEKAKKEEYNEYLRLKEIYDK